jgi:hypothetical protein
MQLLMRIARVVLPETNALPLVTLIPRFPPWLLNPSARNCDWLTVLCVVNVRALMAGLKAAQPITCADWHSMLNPLPVAPYDVQFTNEMSAAFACVSKSSPVLTLS